MDLEIRIQPKSSLALVDLRELWRYRDLFYQLVQRDFSVKYKQTLLGPAWFLIQPLMQTFIFTVVFGKLAGMGTDGIPGFLFFLCNTIVWGYFAATYTSTSTSLLLNMNLFTKVYLPRIIMPLASLFTNAIAISIQCLTFVVAWCWFKFGTPQGEHLHLHATMLLIPFLFVFAAMQGLGFGLWMASFTAKYRDLQHVSPILIQLWMYGSAVVYPLSTVMEKHPPMVKWFSLNPVTFLTELFRYCLLGVGTISWETGIYSVGVTIVVLLTGLYRFNQTARTFVDIA
jgi:lipopolysaccharide transport system permease protein